jgi:hypothetical protein
MGASRGKRYHTGYGVLEHARGKDAARKNGGALSNLLISKGHKGTVIRI